MTDVSSIITSIAQQDGVDPNLALADAYEESRLNPTAVGDNGTSLGLYQLHQGGELGKLTQAQAFDPATNAGVALRAMGRVAAANPGADPGTIAADAQRPANPSAYAAAVDSLYNTLSANPTATLTSWTGDVGSALTGGVAGVVGGAVGGVASGVAGSVGSSIASGLGGIVAPIGTELGKVAGRFALIAGGVGLMVLGVFKIANPGGSVAESVSGAAKTAATTAEHAATAAAA